MFETFITAFKLENTYNVNSVIYSLKQLPIIKRILPYRLYKNQTLKLICNIISILIEIGKQIISKLFYLLLMVLVPTLLYNTPQSNTYLNIFVFLTLAGGIVNDIMFEPTRDKYYGIILMKMDAKKYAISNFIMEIIKTSVGFLPFIILFGLTNDLPITISLLQIVFVIMIKLISTAYNIIMFEKNKKYKKGLLENKLELILIIVFLSGAYLLPLTGYVITKTIFMFIMIITFILCILSIIKILKYNEYTKLFKKLLTIENIQAGEVIQNENFNRKEISEEGIEYNGEIESNKKGFALFHELFVKRHYKILTKAIKTQSIAILFILVVLILLVLFIPSLQEGLNRIILNYLPYFVFIMYLINRGTILTQAMFMNCDHSMLTYRIYRTPKVILGIFKERLKTLIKYNIIPAILIGLGLPILLYLTGGTSNNLNYLILFLSIISMSIFFSVHYLVMYYLLQPYNANTEVKSSTYHTVQGLTYIVCYFMIELKLPTFYFGIATIVFCILYSIISLVIAYFLAPKTFKLRV